MKKLLVAALVLVSLAGCTASTTTFTDADAQDIIFGQITQASLTSLGLTAASNTIQSDTVGNYVAGVSDGDTAFEPAECADSARPLVLLEADAESTDTFYALPALTSGSTAITTRARLFGTDAAAQAFLAEFQRANEACSEFTVTQGDTTDHVELTVSEAAENDEGFRLDTVAGVDNQLLTIRTYVVREGNLVLAIQAPTASDADANLLIAASAAFYARLTNGQAE